MQRLNHHHLYIFWIFGKSESFTKTAAELSIAQSAVTSQLKQLEDALGLSLIDRSNPRFPKVSSEGRKVLDYAENIFESSRELINWATKGALPKNRIVRIGALSGLSRNLQYEFIKPLVGQSGVKFEVITGDQKNLIDQLQNHHLDVILTSRNVQAEMERGFYSHVLLQSPVVFVFKKTRAKLSFQELIANRPIFIPGHQFEAKPELDAYMNRLKFPVQIAGEIDDVALLRLIAIKSDSLVALPEMGIKNDIEDGSVVIVKKLDSVQQRFYAITRTKKLPSSEVESMIDQLKQS